jgi:hypothetical protein
MLQNLSQLPYTEPRTSSMEHSVTVGTYQSEIVQTSTSQAPQLVDRYSVMAFNEVSSRRPISPLEVELTDLTEQPTMEAPSRNLLALHAVRALIPKMKAPHHSALDELLSVAARRHFC